MKKNEKTTTDIWAIPHKMRNNLYIAKYVHNLKNEMLHLFLYDDNLYDLHFRSN